MGQRRVGVGALGSLLGLAVSLCGLVGCTRFGFGASAARTDGADRDVGIAEGSPGNVIVSIGENTDDDVRGATRDATVVWEQPTWGRGGCEALRADRENLLSRALFRFDLRALPDSAVIVNATLVFWITLDLDADTGADGGLLGYPLREAWQDDKVCRSEGFPNWTSRAPNARWSGAGAAGGSRDADVIADISGPLELDTRYALSLAPTTVQRWLSRATDNFGLVLDSKSASGVLMVSSEGADGKRPRLLVEYR